MLNYGYKNINITCIMNYFQNNKLNLDTIIALTHYMKILKWNSHA